MHFGESFTVLLPLKHTPQAVGLHCTLSYQGKSVPTRFFAWCLSPEFQTIISLYNLARGFRGVCGGVLIASGLSHGSERTSCHLLSSCSRSSHQCHTHIYNHLQPNLQNSQHRRLGSTISDRKKFLRQDLSFYLSSVGTNFSEVRLREFTLEQVGLSGLCFTLRLDLFKTTNGIIELKLTLGKRPFFTYAVPILTFFMWLLLKNLSHTRWHRESNFLNSRHMESRWINEKMESSPSPESSSLPETNIVASTFCSQNWGLNCPAAQPTAFPQVAQALTAQHQSWILTAPSAAERQRDTSYFKHISCPNPLWAVKPHTIKLLYFASDEWLISRLAVRLQTWNSVFLATQLLSLLSIRSSCPPSPTPTYLSILTFTNSHNETTTTIASQSITCQTLGNVPLSPIYRVIIRKPQRNMCVAKTAYGAVRPSFSIPWGLSQHLNLSFFQDQLYKTASSLVSSVYRKPWEP